MAAKATDLTKKARVTFLVEVDVDREAYGLRDIAEAVRIEIEAVLIDEGGTVSVRIFRGRA